MSRRLAVGASFALTLALISPMTGVPSTGAQAPPSPNIVLINLDDADWDLLADANLEAHFPNIDRWFRQQGLRFTNLHAADPVCGPSRGSLFRGQYPHNTGITVNQTGWQVFHDRGYTDSEIGMWLRQAGYSTGLVGKYCHEEYPAASRDNGYVPPGWDFFHASLGGKYFSVERNVQGERGPAAAYPDGYRTDIESISAQQFLAETDGRRFLYLAPFAPHATLDPAGMVASRHTSLYFDERIERTPDFNEADISDKSSQFQVLPLATATMVAQLDGLYRDRLRTIAAVDEMVGDLFASLDEQGLLDTTYVILTSDNGYLLGHHRDVGKRSHFDRSTRLPLFVWGPGIEAGSANHLLSHIDITATILDLAGAPLPHFLDGKSFAPLLDDPTVVPEPDWQDAVLIENMSGKSPYGQHIDLRYQALRRYDDIYVEFANGEREYYDLTADPHQLDNAYDGLRRNRQRSLQRQLADLSDCAGPACHGGPEIRAVDTTLDLAAEAVVPGREVVITGRATADAGVDRVEVVVRHVRTRSYWDGSDWSDHYRSVPATLANQGGSRTGWSVTVGGLRADTHWVSARAVDTDGNADPIIPTGFFHAPDDTTPPQTAIVEPISGARIGGPTITISGTATDDVGVDRVELAIVDGSLRRYWNGSAWQDSYTRVTPPLAGPQTNRTWTYTLPAPETGTHMYTGVLAWDTADNMVNDTSVDYVIGSGETEPPDATLIAPTAGELITEATTTITGTVTDGTGVDRVELVIRHDTTVRWWNGSDWQPTYVRVTAATDGPPTDQTFTYTYPTPTVTSSGPTTMYTAAWAWDTLGNMANPTTGGDYLYHTADPGLG